MRLLIAAALAVVGLSQPAGAVLQLSIDVGPINFSCADQAACDLNTAVGILEIGDQTIGGVSVLGSAQTQSIATGVGTFNTLNTTSFQIINTTAADIATTLAIGGTDYLGPVETFSASGSGTYQNAIGSDITMTFYGDGANTQGADNPTDLPGVQLANSGVITATLPTQSFGFNDSGPFVDNDLFSFSLGTTGTLVAGGSLVGRSQAIIAERVAVSEPGTMLLLGSMLLSTGLFLRRWKA